MAWHPRPGLPDTNRVLAVPTSPSANSGLCAGALYLGGVGGGGSQSSDLTKSQHNNYSPCSKSLCINKARLFLKAEFYFATLLMKFAY